MQKFKRHTETRLSYYELWIV